MIKRMDDSHYEQIKGLITYAWPRSIKTWNESSDQATRNLLAHSTNFGLFDEDTLNSQILVTPFDFQLKDRMYKSSGIGSVVSLPENRGNKGIHQLFEEVLAWQKDNNVVLSFLAPFSYRFYRLFGYEHIYHHLHLTWQSAVFGRDEFPNVVKNKCQIKRMTFEDAKASMNKLYHQSPQMKRMSMKREDWWWEYYNKRPHHQRDCYALIFDQEKRAIGYLIYAFEEEKFVIHEMIASNQEAVEGLTWFIHSHSSSFKEFSYKSPVADPSQVQVLQLMKEQWNVKMELTPWMMMRIVNVQKFLADYPYQASTDQLSIEVIDKSAKWNNGIFGPKGESLSQAKQHHLKLSIETMAQLFSGYKDVESLLFEGKIEVDKSETVELFKAILVKEKPVLADDF